MVMKGPSHPGMLIRRGVIDPLGLSVTEAAKALGVTRPALSNLLNGKASLSPEMAIRIEKAFGPKMEHLMRMQLAYDLAQARKRAAKIKVRRALAIPCPPSPAPRWFGISSRRRCNAKIRASPARFWNRHWRTDAR